MDDSDQYYVALGKFVDAFARAEMVVQVSLWSMSRAEISVARAVFSGTRARQAIDFIRRIAEAEEIELTESLEDVFNRFSAINTVRDRLLHYAGDAINDKGDVRSVSNYLLAHVPRALHEFEVTPQGLDDMRHDLYKIAGILMVTFFSSLQQDHPEVAKPFLDRAKTPWRARPPQQSAKRRKNREEKR